jgi:UDP-MurNAc hydroxylase
MTRALRYARQIDALHLFPCAGPACFLDDQLFSLNDLGDDPSNAFPDQRAFLAYLEGEGYDRGRLVTPGDVISLEPDRCQVDHPRGFEREEPFDDKRAYLLRYQARRRDRVEAVRASLPRDQIDVVTELQRWFEPLLDRSDGMSVGIGGIVALDFGPDGVAIDFQRRQVEPLGGQDCVYYFKLDRSLVEYCIVHHLEDWVNELFLSFRFEAERKGPYNEYLFTFFKCLSMERLQYAEGYYAERSAFDQFWEVAGYRVQRRCPHLKADLTKFGRIDNGILTCTLHGWQYELATGRSLTSTDTVLYRRPLAGNGDEPHARAGS